MFHLNLNTGNISECSKKADECIYTGIGGFNNHFETLEEATKEKHKLFKNQFTWFGLRNHYSQTKHDKKVEQLTDVIPYKKDKELRSFINSSRANFRVASDIIVKRVEAKRRTEKYRNYTARMVDFYVNSDFYNDFTKLYKSDRLGRAVKIDDSQLDNKVLAETLAATDLAILAEYDCAGKDDSVKPEWLVNDFNDFKERRLVKHSSILNNPSRKAHKSKENKQQGKYGTSKQSFDAMYRGTVWERKIRNDFALDNPDLTVYHVEGRFRNSDELWQLGLFDGLFSDREDKVPSGILEIKTAKDKKNWSKGVPINYRTQVLFYLHITNLDKAIVRVLINERETKDYTIYRDDELVPGSNVNMSLYIQDRVVPLLREWKTM